MHAMPVVPLSLALSVFSCARADAAQRTPPSCGQTEIFHLPANAVGGAPRVVVEAVLGDIRVEGGSSADIEVAATFASAGEAERSRWRVEALATAAGATVRALCDESGSSPSSVCGRVRIDFVLRVPRQSELLLTGVESSIAVEGVQGNAAIDTAFGEVSVRDGGAISASALDGLVRIAGARSVELSTRGGDLRVTGVPGAVRIRTRTGRALVEAEGSAPRLDFRAEAGDLRWSGR